MLVGIEGTGLAIILSNISSSNFPAVYKVF